MLPIGTQAPDFALEADTGVQLSLADLLTGPLVLYFYPQDETPGCTKEACTFRDHYEDFLSLGAKVVGVSSDPVETHRRFKARYKLPFLLLSDPGRKVARLYQVPLTLGIIPGRVTYVIAPDRIILYAFSSQFRPRLHVKKAKAIISNLRSPARQ